MRLRHEFVDHIPEQLEDGVLYVSIRFGTMVHRCACGCGEEVVTPLGPAEWRITFDGRTVSLEPSIGNWSFPCKSHYWIDAGRIRWARGFSEAEIAMVRQEARSRREGYYRKEHAEGFEQASGSDTQCGSRKSMWGRLRDLLYAWTSGRD